MFILPLNEAHSKEPENGFCFCLMVFFSVALWNWDILFESESLPKILGAEPVLVGVEGVTGDSMFIVAQFVEMFS